MRGVGLVAPPPSGGIRIPVLAENVAARSAFFGQPGVDLVEVRAGVALDFFADGFAPVDAVFGTAVAPPVDVEPRPAAIVLLEVLINVAENLRDFRVGIDAANPAVSQLEQNELAATVDADALRHVDLVVAELAIHVVIEDVGHAALAQTIGHAGTAEEGGDDAGAGDFADGVVVLVGDVKSVADGIEDERRRA